MPDLQRVGVREAVVPSCLLPPGRTRQLRLARALEGVLDSKYSGGFLNHPAVGPVFYRPRFGLRVAGPDRLLLLGLHRSIYYYSTLCKLEKWESYFLD